MIPNDGGKWSLPGRFIKITDQIETITHKGDLLCFYKRSRYRLTGGRGQRRTEERQHIGGPPMITLSAAKADPLFFCRAKRRIDLEAICFSELQEFLGKRITPARRWYLFQDG